MPAGFGFDGSLIFPFVEEFINYNLVVEEVNRVLTSIFLGGIYVDVASPFDISNGGMNETGYYRHHRAHSDIAAFDNAVGDSDAGGLATTRLLDSEIVNADVLISAYNYRHSILSKLPSLSPSLFIDAFT